ncbi:alpha/beta hydrolase [Hymenobacter wooponensis]|uniref:Esterase family protein n=1 Tax=Hymenobacter wooponensis TaxID=1525360 RepID=A0A4Z0MVI8_9BACT|nr:alpha/beta hydrolase-fold protein [Hymenobacter wooponensis]TGD83237.1 esterase family protein [Hymenobacter wooponensis]
MLAQLPTRGLAPSLKSVLLLALCWLLALPLTAQTASAPATGRVVVKTLDSKLLRGNPGGENPRRRVSVYLPADYETHPQRRYPVVYYLHGFTWNDSLIFNQDGMKALLDQAIADRQIRPFILVVPNEQTRFGGSWYVNSATNGPWADFTARELVEFIDKNFRTLARPGSRGLAGHSMGGGGTIRLAMQFPGTWAAAYALSPAFLGAHPSYLPGPGLPIALRAKSFADVQGSHVALATVSLSRALSAAPKNQPFGAELPGSLGPDSVARRDAVLGRWVGSTPIAQLPTRIAALRQLRALAFDWGAQDEVRHIPPTCYTFSSWLNSFGLRHTAQEYEGTHGSRIMGRTGRIYQQVLPFFNTHLDFE